MEYEKTNSVYLSGRISQAPKFSHELYGGEKFYVFYFDVQRLSGNVDTLPITISERLMQLQKFAFDCGTKIDVYGEYRSHNQDEKNGKSKLLLSVLCKDVAAKTAEHDCNNIELTGYICKPPIYRETPFKRQICDILLAVNRPFFKKSDYIPLIAWGRNALLAKNFMVGDKISVQGRIQSRIFTKIIDEISYEKTAYEVSIQDISNYQEKIDAHISLQEKEFSL